MLYGQESSSQREERAAAEDSEARRQTAEVRGEHLTAIHPVFRTSPFSAEMRRARTDSLTARILFLDEGNFCRYVHGALRAISAHLFVHMLLLSENEVQILQTFKRHP